MPWPISPAPSTPTFSICCAIVRYLRSRSPLKKPEPTGKGRGRASTTARRGHFQKLGMFGEQSPPRKSRPEEACSCRFAGLSTTIVAALACAVLTPGAASAFGHPGPPSSASFATHHHARQHGTRQRRSQSLRGCRRARLRRRGGARGHARQQLQRRRKPPGHRHDDRAGRAERPPLVFAKIEPATLPGPCPGGVGLTTALAILPGGYVVVGSLPTERQSGHRAGGLPDRARQLGHVVRTIAGGPVNGPWDMTAVSRARARRCSSPTCSTARSPRAKRQRTAAPWYASAVQPPTATRRRYAPSG